MVMKGVKAIYVGANVLVLLVTLYAFDGKPNSDIDIFLAWTMLVLGFPSSLLMALLFTGIATVLDKYFSTIIPTTYLTLVLTWVGFFVLGYLQWFTLVRFTVGKLRERR